MPVRAEAEIWGIVPPVAGPVFGGGCCEGVVEGGGASIFMALDSWGCCELLGGFGQQGRRGGKPSGSLRSGFGWCWRLLNDDVDILELRQLCSAAVGAVQQATYRITVVVVVVIIVVVA